MLDCLDAFYGGAVGGGKILSNKGVILTPFGWKKGKDLVKGDLVNNPDGSVQRIIQVHPEVHLDCWRVEFSDGTYTDVAKEHLWLSWKGGKGRKIKNIRTFGIDSAEVIETQELAQWIERGYIPQIPVCEPQSFNRTTKEKDRLDPYLLGVLLGDGCLTQKNIRISCHEDDKKHYEFIFGSDEINYDIAQTISFGGKATKHIVNKLRLYGLYKKKSHNKFIPEIYKYSSVKDRMQLIRGLMDTDGNNAHKKNSCYYCTISKQLADDVAFVLRSLGSIVTINKKKAGYRDKDGVYIRCNDAYNLYIKTNTPNDYFSMERKKWNEVKNKNPLAKKIVKVEKHGKIKGRCITVSNPNGLYITNDFIVTHNSDALLMAALQYVDVPGYSAILLRNTYKNLSKASGLIPRSHEWLAGTDAKWKGGDHWEFPTGPNTAPARLEFGYLDGPMDHFNYQSAEYQFVGIDEVVQTRKTQALYMFTRMRRLIDSGIPIRFRCASNPPTKEQLARGSWVKDRYISANKDPKRIFVSAKMQDNLFLDVDEYKDTFAESGLDPVTRKQLEDGDWDIRAKGNMFQREWFPIVGVAPVRNIKWIRYWDLAHTEYDETAAKKGEDQPAYTCGALVGMTPDGLFFIKSIIRAQLSPRNVESLVRQTADMDGKKVVIWMEQEPAGGKSVVDHYRRNVLRGFTFKPDKKTKSKVSSWGPFATQAEGRNVMLVDGHWIPDFLEEIEIAPNGVFKDQLDCVSGAINKLCGIGVGARVGIRAC